MTCSLRHTFLPILICQKLVLLLVFACTRVCVRVRERERDRARQSRHANVKFICGMTPPLLADRLRGLTDRDRLTLCAFVWCAFLYATSSSGMLANSLATSSCARSKSAT